MKPGFDTSPPS